MRLFKKLFIWITGKDKNITPYKHYKRWTKNDVDKLIVMAFDDKLTMSEISFLLGRTESSIRYKLNNLKDKDVGL